MLLMKILLVIMNLIVLIGLVLFLIRTIIFFIPTIFGAVYVPSTDDRLQTMLELAQIQKKDLVADVGSGDGKIILEVGKRGFQVEGIELNPLLIKQTRDKIKKQGLQNRVKVIQGNFFKIDLSKYDVILLYQISRIMNQLESKIKKEAKPGCRVVSNYFKFPNWQAKKTQNQVHLYIKE